MNIFVDKTVFNVSEVLLPGAVIEPNIEKY
jgi:hypothetical protein